MASKVFPAQYAGECSECGETFEEDDDIRFNDNDVIVAQDCCGYVYDEDDD